MRRWMVIVMLTALPAFGQTPPGREGYRLVDGRWLRPTGEFHFRDIVKAEFLAGRLSLSLEPNGDWRPKLPPNRRVLGENRDDGSLWHILTTRSAAAVVPGSQLRVLVMLRTDERPPDRDAPPTLVRLTLTGQKALLRAVGRVEGRIAWVEYHANSDGTLPRLTVQIEGRGGIDITGDDLRDLISRRPQIVRQFLAPIVRQIAGTNLLRPRAADVYRVFDAIEPTAAEMASLQAALPGLNDDDPAARDAATRQLDELGFGGVLAALRLDAARLTPEQARRIADLIARNSLGDFDPEAARNDRLFLADALADPDPRVRAAARERLGQLTD